MSQIEFEPSESRLERQAAESIYEDTDLLTVIHVFDFSEIAVYTAGELGWKQTVSAYWLEQASQIFSSETAVVNQQELVTDQHSEHLPSVPLPNDHPGFGIDLDYVDVTGCYTGEGDVPDILG